MAPGVSRGSSKGRKVAGRGVALATIRFRGMREPRLRFDRTAVGLVERLQAAVTPFVPSGKTVIVTITAPIRQDSKTGVVLEGKIRGLLARGRQQLQTRIHGNRVQVRILKGGAGRTSKLVGFVHNPEPSPIVLFEVARFVLASLGSGKGKGDRWLIVANEEGRAPLETVRQVCLALRARTVLKRILVRESEGLRALGVKGNGRGPAVRRVAPRRPGG